MHEVVQDWYANFVNVDQELLFELILAANYMDIKPLLDLTCATVASMIKGKLRSFPSAHVINFFCLASSTHTHLTHTPICRQDTRRDS